MQIELGIIIIVVLAVIATLIAYMLITSRKKAMYDIENHKAILDEVRSSFERQIYTLNDRLIQSEERWRDVNHLLLRREYRENSESIQTIQKTHYNEFLKANGIQENDLIMNKRMIFVLTPFNSLFYNEFMIIKEVCTSLGFTCIRGDEKQFKGDIFPEMLRYILQARVVIANINGRNPNVLYELGVAQALDKYVILLSKEPRDLPVDIKSQRFLIFHDSDNLANLLKFELQKLI